ncbi:class I SAM-dependent methyltransferase [Catenuloplanes japonicus]|uniref:class I SAM-dependent methyltransferase n=1 Tax=Catenuloplanes japonicus TaxID=33876 RepID=UPI000524FEEB|nr:class I SAM-dependent methyltransferase [Catenuloplanes japonicus]
MPTNKRSHEHREAAESFGVDAERYDRTRPRYPAEMITAILEATDGRDVLDVGCGTGISSRPFAEAGCRVLGVEPDPRMAAVARRHGIEVEESAFEVWDARERTFDLVVAGQTWHWVDPVAGAHRAADVLRPHGRIALFWNAMEPEPAIAAAFAQVTARLLPEAPAASSVAGAYDAMSGAAAEGLRTTGRFDEPEIWRYGWERRYTRDEWLDQLPTFGFHTRLPPERLGPILDANGAVIDEAGGVFRMCFTAVAVTANRR